MSLLSFLSSGSVVDAEEEQSHEDEGAAEFSVEFVDQGTTETDANSIFSVNTLEDHNVIVGFPPGTLLEAFRAREEEEEESSVSRTILSSAPSGEVVQYLPESQAISVAVTPHPMLASGNALSISTTESLYQDLALGDESSLNSSANERHNDLENSTSDLSFDVSMLDSSLLCDDCQYPSTSSSASTCTPTPNVDSNTVAVRHDRSTFVTAVGNRLATVPEDKAFAWYSHFNDQDWDQFRQAADAVLDAMAEGPSQNPPVVVLPPVAPPGKLPSATSTSYVASDLVPEEFVCPLCRDVVVGATTLGCGCPASTVCTECWECYVTVHASIVMVDNVDDDDDYVSVENRSESATTTTTTYPSCPSCHGSVYRKPVPCHALDVAILQAIQNITTVDGENATTAMAQLQQAYYYRLNKWRLELQHRLDEWNKEQAVEREHLLAQCIQREEELLWMKQTTHKVPFWKTKSFEVAIFLLAASFLLVRR